MKKITTILKENQKIDKQIEDLIETKVKMYFTKDTISKKVNGPDIVDTVYVEGYESEGKDTHGMLFMVGIINGDTLEEVSFEELVALKTLLNKIL